MAILYRSNRMPSKGAILVTNPRRSNTMRRRRNAIKMRKNASKHSYLMAYTKHLQDSGKMDGYIQTAAFRKMRQRAGKKKAAAAKGTKLWNQWWNKAQKDKSWKKFSTWVGPKGSYGKGGGTARKAASARRRAYDARVKKYLSGTGKRKPKPKNSTSRSGSKGKSTLMKAWINFRKAKKGDSGTVGDMWQKLTPAQKKAWATKTKNNPRRRRNAVAIRRRNYKLRGVKGTAKLNIMPIRKAFLKSVKGSPLSRREREQKYYFEFLPKHLSKLVNAGKINKERAQELIAKLTVRHIKKGGLATKAQKEMAYKTQVLDYSQGKGWTPKRRAYQQRKAAGKVKPRQRKGVQAKTTKPKTTRKPVSAKGRSTAKGKNAWNKHRSLYKGMGYSQKQISKMYKTGIDCVPAKRRKVSAKSRTAAKGKAGSWKGFNRITKGKLTQARKMRIWKKVKAGTMSLAQVRTLVKPLGRKAYQYKKETYAQKKRRLGQRQKRGIAAILQKSDAAKALLRTNPRHGGVFNFLVNQYGKFGDMVSSMPLVGFLGTPVALGLTGATVGYGLCQVAKGFTIPLLGYQVPGFGPLLGEVPMVGPYLEKVAYTTLGFSLGVVGGILSKLPLTDRVFSTNGAAAFGALATLGGAVADIIDHCRGASGSGYSSPGHVSAMHGRPGYGAGGRGLSRAQVAATRAGPHAVHALAQRSQEGKNLEALVNLIGFSKVQKLAYMSPSAQRKALLKVKAHLQRAGRGSRRPARLPSQGRSTLPASSPLSGASNGAGAAQGLGYGALMFAGQGY